MNITEKMEASLDELGDIVANFSIPFVNYFASTPQWVEAIEIQDKLDKYYQKKDIMGFTMHVNKLKKLWEYVLHNFKEERGKVSVKIVGPKDSEFIDLPEYHQMVLPQSTNVLNKNPQKIRRSK